MVRALPGACGPSSIKRQKLVEDYKKHVRLCRALTVASTSLTRQAAVCLLGDTPETQHLHEVGKGTNMRSRGTT